MKIPKNTYSLIVLLGLLAMACQGPGPSGEETPSSTEGGPPPDARFDPLELDEDHQIIPERYPQTGEISGAAVVDEPVVPDGPTRPEIVAGDPAAEAPHGEVYRVQLFTSQVYGEAQGARRVAEEVFDREVLVDYEVPYFKVRVGSFYDRDLAEEYQQRAKAAGYTEAWVVMVNVALKKAPPLYDSLRTDDSRGGDDADHDK